MQARIFALGVLEKAFSQVDLFLKGKKSMEMYCVRSKRPHTLGLLLVVILPTYSWALDCVKEGDKVTDWYVAGHLAQTFNRPTLPSTDDNDKHQNAG